MEECPLLKEGNWYHCYISEADYEVEVDKLASLVGSLYCTVGGMDREEISWIVEMLYHLSSSLRNGYKLTTEETERLVAIGHKYDSILPEGIILPLGTYQDSAICHVIRSECNYMIVLLNKFAQDPFMNVDERLFEVYTSLSQYFFGMAVYKNSLLNKEFKRRD